MSVYCTLLLFRNNISNVVIMVYLTDFNSEGTLRIIIFSFHQSEVELPNGEGDAVLDSGPQSALRLPWPCLARSQVKESVNIAMLWDSKQETS